MESTHFLPIKAKADANLVDLLLIGWHGCDRLQRFFRHDDRNFRPQNGHAAQGAGRRLSECQKLLWGEALFVTANNIFQKGGKGKGKKIPIAG